MGWAQYFLLTLYTVSTLISRSKQITKLLCRHGGEQGSLGALETPGAGGAGNKEGSERNLATPAPAAPASPARNIFTIW